MSGRTRELARYVANGLAATVVHYGVLTFNLEVLGLGSAGVSNGIAAIFGITASFLGSLYFVFPGARAPFATLIMKFGSLYGFIAVLHALFLSIWTDWLGLDYRLGFFFATGMQVSLSYLGNKFLVFRR